MPNWVECELIVSGEPDRLKEFINFVKSDETVFDFNKIVPMPESLHLEAGAAEMGYEVKYGDYTQYLDAPWVKEAGVTTKEGLIKLIEDKHPEYIEMAEQYKFNLDTYGSRHWYDWSIENWGTKWNASDTERDDDCDSVIEYTFNTAWAPPEPVILSASKQFLNLNFELNYFEGGMGFKGTYIVENGEVVDEHQSDYHGRRGG
jgi:hypothetical protein